MFFLVFLVLQTNTGIVPFQFIYHPTLGSLKYRNIAVTKGSNCAPCLATWPSSGLQLVRPTGDGTRPPFVSSYRECDALRGVTLGQLCKTFGSLLCRQSKTDLSSSLGKHLKK
jgi:hypothetical protein